MKYNVVIPLSQSNIPLLKTLSFYIKNNLDVKDIVVISKGDCKDKIKELSPDCIFFDEDKIVEGLTFNNITELVHKRNKYSRNRSGWYFQQFLKYSYAYLCKDEYYLIWDADTIPINKIHMVDEESKPYFDVKHEYHKPYFSTIGRLFNNDVKKPLPFSFISEHMLFKTEYVIEMLNRIEANSNIDGTKYFEKIINAVRKVDISGSGFADYETYGCYVSRYYPGLYKERIVPSLREGMIVFGENPTPEQLEWAAKDYDIVSFEFSRKQDVKIKEKLNLIMQNQSLKDFVEQNNIAEYI